jgi:hypothetical protein
MAELSNPLLQQAEDKLESGLTPENRVHWMQIVNEALHVTLANGADGLMAALAKSKDPVADAARGAVSVCLILRHDHDSKQGVVPMPLKAMVPATLSLMLRGLDFIDRSKIAPVGNAELVRATHIWTDFVFARFGISKAGLANAGTKVHALTRDPAAIAAMQLKAGFTRHPNAATPTPLPPGPGGLINGRASTAEQQ